MIITINNFCNSKSITKECAKFGLRSRRRYLRVMEILDRISLLKFAQLTEYSKSGYAFLLTDKGKGWEQTDFFSHCIGHRKLQKMQLSVPNSIHDM